MGFIGFVCFYLFFFLQDTRVFLKLILLPCAVIFNCFRLGDLAGGLDLNLALVAITHISPEAHMHHSLSLFLLLTNHPQRPWIPGIDGVKRKMG